MRERSSAFDTALSDARLRCILCEGLLPTPIAAAIEQEPDSVCLRCSALPPDDRRILRDRAMARVLRRDLAH
jgi:hypothetical protein